MMHFYVLITNMQEVCKYPISQLVKVEIELIYRYLIYWFLINFGILIANMQKLNVLDNYVNIYY